MRRLAWRVADWSASKLAEVGRPSGARADSASHHRAGRAGWSPRRVHRAGRPARRGRRAACRGRRAVRRAASAGLRAPSVVRPVRRQRERREPRLPAPCPERVQATAVQRGRRQLPAACRVPWAFRPRVRRAYPARPARLVQRAPLPRGARTWAGRCRAEGAASPPVPGCRSAAMTGKPARRAGRRRVPAELQQAGWAGRLRARRAGRRA